MAAVGPKGTVKIIGKPRRIRQADPLIGTVNDLGR
jgi:hypothetical protein